MRTLALALLVTATAALARVGGGEHYDSGRSSDSGGDSGIGELIFQVLFQLVFRYPAVGIPLVVVVVIIFFVIRRREGSDTTRQALDEAEMRRQTTVASRDVDRWVGALKTRDPQFDLIAFLDRSRKLFLEVQESWFTRNLEPVRRYLSDATFTRLSIQLKLLDLQGVRDAIADTQVIDLKIIGLEQSPFFDTVHLRVNAQARDDDAASTMSDGQARGLAKQKPLEPFTEVWSFVRKPGAVTKDSQGGCPNCGAPFTGGASNQCEFCKAIVNSGNYDWVLAEITQGSEYRGSEGAEVTGLADSRRRDPELNTEALEDRASLCFWKWVDAQATGEAAKLSKIADPEVTARVKTELDALAAQGKHKVFLECTVGAVNTLALSQSADRDLAHLEVRWSARSGIVANAQKPGTLPSMPQRSVFTLHRKSGAQTVTANGLSTSRCPNCGAPLSDNASVSCEFCGTMLATGERDWVIREIASWESWGHQARQMNRVEAAPRRVDQEERQRLLYLMAAMAAADGVVDAKEKKLLRLCSERWNVPFANVELALTAGPALFDRLIVRGSGEAESFLQELISMALIDGRIDRKERLLLQSAADHLGLSGRLEAMISAPRAEVTE